jgi:hypothetical protein
MAMAAAVVGPAAGCYRLAALSFGAGDFHGKLGEDGRSPAEQ